MLIFNCADEEQQHILIKGGLSSVKNYERFSMQFQAFWVSYLLLFFILSLLLFWRAGSQQCYYDVEASNCLCVLATWQRGRHPIGSLISAHDDYLRLWSSKPTWILICLSTYRYCHHVAMIIHQPFLVFVLELGTAGSIYGKDRTASPKKKKKMLRHRTDLGPRYVIVEYLLIYTRWHHAPACQKLMLVQLYYRMSHRQVWRFE